MSVLKKYNEGTSQWEAVVIGKQGPSGTVAVTAPLTNSGTSSAAVLGVDYSALQYGQNVLINGGFDVWQRGTSFTANAIYTADRWVNTMLTSGGVVSQITSVPTGFRYGIKIQRNSGQTSTDYFSIAQALETSTSVPLAGQTLTLSFWAKAGANLSNQMFIRLYSGTGTDQAAFSFGGWTGYSEWQASGSLSATTSWVRYTMTQTVPSTATQVGLRIGFQGAGTAGSDDSLHLAGIQLEIGSQATPFKRAGGTIQGELAACQRYYWRQSADSTLNAVHYGSGSANSSSLIQFDIVNPVPMRVSPTSVEWSSLSAYDGANDLSASGVGISGNRTNPRLAVVELSVSGASQFRPYHLKVSSSSGYLALNAEL